MIQADVVPMRACVCALLVLLVWFMDVFVKKKKGLPPHAAPIGRCGAPPPAAPRAHAPHGRLAPCTTTRSSTPSAPTRRSDPTGSSSSRSWSCRKPRFPAPQVHAHAQNSNPARHAHPQHPQHRTPLAHSRTWLRVPELGPHTTLTQSCSPTLAYTAALTLMFCYSAIWCEASSGSYPPLWR